jgi:hypothetical protein
MSLIYLNVAFRHIFGYMCPALQKCFYFRALSTSFNEWVMRVIYRNEI